MFGKPGRCEDFFTFPKKHDCDDCFNQAVVRKMVNDTKKNDEKKGKRNFRIKSFDILFFILNGIKQFKRARYF